MVRSTVEGAKGTDWLVWECSVNEEYVRKPYD